MHGPISWTGLRNWDLKPNPNEAWGVLLGEFKRLSVIQYIWFCLSQDWGDLGQDAVKESFCRCLLNIAADKTLSYQNWMAFEEAFTRLKREFGYEALSVEDCETLLSDFSIPYGSTSYALDNLAELNKAVRNDYPDVIIQGGYYGSTLEFIVGRGQVRSVGNFTVFEIREEIWRSCTTVMAMAAMIGNKEIYVRREALKTIFYYKWKPIVQYPHFIGYTEAEKEGFELKKATLEAYELHTLADFERIEPDFIADLEHNVLTHELGHAVIQHHTLPLRIATMGEGIKMLGAQVMTDLLEVLADIAPRHGDLMGPLYGMLELYKTDYKRFLRRYWMYRSDVWFFDTANTYMYTYSRWITDIMKAVYEKPAVEELSRYCTMLVEEVVRCGTDIEAELHKLSFIQEGNALTFEAFWEMSLNDVPESAKEDEYVRLSWVWNRVFEEAQKQAVFTEAIGSLFAGIEKRVSKILKDPTPIQPTPPCSASTPPKRG
jgi:hypothetical protein